MSYDAQDLELETACELSERQIMGREWLGAESVNVLGTAEGGLWFESLRKPEGLETTWSGIVNGVSLKAKISGIQSVNLYTHKIEPLN